MSHTAEQLQALAEACEQFRGATAPDGYPDGLALCVIDSVQSTGVTYSSVENVVDVQVSLFVITNLNHGRLVLC